MIRKPNSFTEKYNNGNYEYVAGSIDMEDTSPEALNCYTYSDCMSLLENIKDNIFKINIENNLSDFYREWLLDLCDRIGDIQNYLPPFELVYHKASHNKNVEEVSL